MLFTKKNHLIGLDIGSRTLKVGEIIETRRGGMILNKFGASTIPDGAIDDGSVKDPESVAEVIRSLLADQKIREKNVSVSIGGNSVMIKTIHVQNMTDEELQEKIHVEAEQYIPYNIDEVKLDFDILGESSTDANRLEVILVAAKKEMLTGYISLIDLAGLNPCVIDVDALALQNIYDFSYGMQEDIVVLVDIGFSKITLNIVKNGRSLLTRGAISSGGVNQIDSMIADRAACSMEEAEKIKISGISDRMASQEISAIITQATDEWGIEIRRAIDFFYSSFPDDQIRKILLSGGGANIHGFKESLAFKTGLDVEIIDPFTNFTLDRRLDSSVLQQFQPQAAICMGLAIRRIYDK